MSLSTRHLLGIKDLTVDDISLILKNGGTIQRSFTAACKESAIAS
jgi:aspartate carbamoyltransferase catalytic subunit